MQMQLWTDKNLTRCFRECREVLHTREPRILPPSPSTNTFLGGSPCTMHYPLIATIGLTMISAWSRPLCTFSSFFWREFDGQTRTLSGTRWATCLPSKLLSDAPAHGSWWIGELLWSCNYLQIACLPASKDLNLPIYYGILSPRGETWWGQCNPSTHDSNPQLEEILSRRLTWVPEGEGHRVSLRW